MSPARSCSDPSCPFLQLMDEFKPSAFTPFLRRFTDERARDLQDTQQLYNRVRSLHRASPYSADDAEITFGTAIYDECPYLSDPLQPVVARAIHDILKLETPIFQCPQVDFGRAHLSLKESVDLRHFLRAKEYFHAT